MSNVDRLDNSSDHWESFLDAEGDALDDAFSQLHLDLTSESRSTHLSTPASQQSPRSYSKDPITVSDMLNNNQSDNDSWSANSDRGVNVLSKEEAQRRCRVEAEEVVSRSMLVPPSPLLPTAHQTLRDESPLDTHEEDGDEEEPILSPDKKKMTAVPPVVVAPADDAAAFSRVEHEETSTRGKMYVAEHSFRQAIRDLMAASPVLPLEAKAVNGVEEDERLTHTGSSCGETSSQGVKGVHEARVKSEEEEEGIANSTRGMPSDDNFPSSDNSSAARKRDVVEEEEPPQQKQPQQKQPQQKQPPRSVVASNSILYPDEPAASPKVVSEAGVAGGLKECISNPLAVPAAVEVQDEVFPDAHQVMLDAIYQMYGLLPSNTYRMMATDYYDTVVAVGGTLNVEKADDAAGYFSKLEPWVAQNLMQLWTTKTVMMDVREWIRTKYDEKLAADVKRSGRKKSCVFAPGYREANSPVHWLTLRDCCCVLVNSLGRAHNELYKKEDVIPPVTAKQVRDWSLYYIHFGLQRLVRDQSNAHTIIFRSVFTLLCPSDHRTVAYPVFESVFLSQVLSKSSKDEVSAKTNYDYACPYFKRDGLSYLPFSILLRHLCKQQKSGIVSLLKLRRLLDDVMQPATSMKLLQHQHTAYPVFPAYLVRRGVDGLASIGAAFHSFTTFFNDLATPPPVREGDKNADELLRRLAMRLPLDTATHVATKCLLILVLFVSWLETDFKDVEDGAVDVRFWTQRIFSEANAYYRFSHKALNEEDHKTACAEVITLFYAFFDAKDGGGVFLKYVNSKKVVDMASLGALRGEINTSLTVKKDPNASSTATSPTLAGDDEDFTKMPDGPLLLRRLIFNLMMTVGAVFFSYDSYIDGVVTFYSRDHVDSLHSSLDATLYRDELRYASNAFREMDAITYHTKVFNQIIDKSMGYLQAMWIGTRWLRAEVQLCTTGALSEPSSSNVPQTFTQCSAFLADCILAGWPHQRRERIPFRRVPKVTADRVPVDEDAVPPDFNDTRGTDFDVTHRSVDSVFADLVYVSKEGSSSF